MQVEEKLRQSQKMQAAGQLGPGMQVLVKPFELDRVGRRVRELLSS